MKHLQRTFAPLKWKLTLSYLLVAMISILCNEFASVTYNFISNLSPQTQRNMIAGRLQMMSTEAAFYVKPPVDSQGLQAWLVRTAQRDPLLSSALPKSSKSPFQFLGVVSQEQRVIAGYGSHVPDSSVQLSSTLSPTASALLTRVLQGQGVPTMNPGDPNGDPGVANREMTIEPDQNIFIAVPIPGNHGSTQGAIVLQMGPMSTFDLLTALPALTAPMLQSLVQFLPILLVLFIPLLFFAHSFTRRLNRLTKAANTWSTGDFSVVVQDSKDDEIGQLTRHLNSMTQQLSNLIKVQHEFATLEERNRLARELHDTIKQQLFALAFQVNIVKKLYTVRNDKLALHLGEAQKILQDIQQEMANLILAMRPGTLGNKALPISIEEYLEKWERQNGIMTSFLPNIEEQAQKMCVPPVVKETFFRIMQEALSNVARHSKATYVEIVLSISCSQITLKITDNGQGFNYNERKESGIGISSMGERMKNINGTLQIKSVAMRGTQIFALYKSKETDPQVAAIPGMKRNDLVSL